MTTEEDQGASALPERLRELPSRLLSQASAHATRLVTEGLSGADARKWHYATLVALDEFGPASQAALSGRTDIHRSDLVAVINELAARELVERTPDPADRRRNVITLTTAGRAACASWSNCSPRPRRSFCPLCPRRSASSSSTCSGGSSRTTHAAAPRWELTGGKSAFGYVDTRLPRPARATSHI